MSTQPSPVSIILDIETLHRAPGALITEIALVAFNRKDFVPYHEVVIRPGFYHQLQHGRLICPDTIAYHRKHGTLALSVTDEAPDLTIKKSPSSFKRTDPSASGSKAPTSTAPSSKTSTSNSARNFRGNTGGSATPAPFGTPPSPASSTIPARIARWKTARPPCTTSPNPSSPSNALKLPDRRRNRLVTTAPEKS